MFNKVAGALHEAMYYVGCRRLLQVMIITLHLQLSRYQQATRMTGLGVRPIGFLAS